jgi:hypothetical protein
LFELEDTEGLDVIMHQGPLAVMKMVESGQDFATDVDVPFSDNAQKCNLANISFRKNDLWRASGLFLSSLEAK